MTLDCVKSIVEKLHAQLTKVQSINGAPITQFRKFVAVRCCRLKVMAHILVRCFSIAIRIVCDLGVLEHFQSTL